MKKRLVSILCAGVLTAGLLAGCGGSSNSTKTDDAAEKTEEAAEVVEEAATEKAAEAATEVAEAAATTSEAAGLDGIQASEEFYAQADLASLNGKKIGITIQSLQNAYWAGVMTALEEVLTENGAEVTIVACDDNSATQISQIENFISSGCELIMIHPSDADAVEDAAKEARDYGVKVMCWDDPMTNTDANWVLDNTTLGKAIGDLAAEFINANYSEDNKAQVALLGYPQTKILLERANGIKAGLEANAGGKYEIVAEQNGLVANEAQTSMETILQAYPDCKVVVGVGAGAMIGGNEALVTSLNGAEVPADMGVITTDVTKQQLTLLQQGDQAIRGIVGFEGSDEDTATACAQMFALILGEKIEQGTNVYRTLSNIDASNIDDILAGMK